MRQGNLQSKYYLWVFSSLTSIKWNRPAQHGAVFDSMMFNTTSRQKCISRLPKTIWIFEKPGSPPPISKVNTNYYSWKLNSQDGFVAKRQKLEQLFNDNSFGNLPKEKKKKKTKPVPDNSSFFSFSQETWRTWKTWWGLSSQQLFDTRYYWWNDGFVPLESGEWFSILHFYSTC